MSKLCWIGLILVNIAIVTGRRKLAKIPRRDGAARRPLPPMVARPVGVALPPPIPVRPGKYHAVPTETSPYKSKPELGEASSEESSVESEIDAEVIPEDEKVPDRSRGKSNKICLLVANQVKALMSLPDEKKRRGEAFMQALQKKITFLSLPDAKKGDVIKALKNIMELMPLEDEVNTLKEEKQNKLAADKRMWLTPGMSRITEVDSVKTPSSSQFSSLESLMRDLSALCHKEFKSEEKKANLSSE